MYFDDLNVDNVLLCCMKAYERPECIMSEFGEDILLGLSICRSCYKTQRFRDL